MASQPFHLTGKGLPLGESWPVGGANISMELRIGILEYAVGAGTDLQAYAGNVTANRSLTTPGL